MTVTSLAARILLLLTLSAPMAWAGEVRVLNEAPLLADGAGELRVLLVVPGLQPSDRVKLKPAEGELVAMQQDGERLVVTLRPPQAYSDGTLRLTVSVRGAMKLDEDVLIPLHPPHKAQVGLSFSPETWTAGQKGAVTVTLKPEGSHPLPATARRYAVAASLGVVSALKANPDGSFTATWTPPAKITGPVNVVFTTTDLTAPDVVHGLSVFPVMMKRPQVVSATPGSRNTLVVGETPYGPVDAGADGKASFSVLMDPRAPTATLQSVDNSGKRTDSVVPLDVGGGPILLFAPLSSAVPAGQTVSLWVAALKADGTPWSDVPPRIDGLADPVVEGKGWFRYTATAPQALGPWTLNAAMGEQKASLTLQVIDPPSIVSLTANPRTLGEGAGEISVTATAKSAAGVALTQRPLVWSADGLTPVGPPKANGDGTVTQKYKVSASQQSARVLARLSLKPTGLATARVVAWPLRPGVPADGQSVVELVVLTVDVWGMPVPNQTVALTAPLGDGALAPTVKTDAQGLAVVRYRAGTQPGPARVRLDAGGVVGELILWQTAPGEDAPVLPALGDAQDFAALELQQRGASTLRLTRVGADSGPPAAVSVATVPGYTTPGAAVLVTVRVLDAQGKAAVGEPPKITASIGTVGVLSDSGDGSYSVPVQLPPGQDGPLTVTVSVGSAQGAASVPTLASLGGPEALASGGGVPSGGGGNTGGARPSGGGGGGVAPSGGGGARPAGGGGGGLNDDARLRMRASAFEMAYLQETSSSGLGAAPLGAAFSALPPSGAVGAGLSMEIWPTRGALGIDARTKLGLYRVSVGAGIAEVKLIDAVTPTQLGLHYRIRTQSPVSFFVGGWGSLTDTLLFEFETPARASVAGVNQLVFGGRVGGGLMIETDRVYARIEVGESFTPLPSVTHAAFTLDVLRNNSNALWTFGLDYDRHNLSLTVGEGALEDTVTVSAQQITAMAGLGMAF
ncbi:Ig-like domain-containing protein [Myxococcota bacterium]|nr:Ig-like domain-containing protein [Myxococcota bacterium]